MSDELDLNLDLETLRRKVADAAWESFFDLVTELFYRPESDFEPQSACLGCDHRGDGIRQQPDGALTCSVCGRTVDQ